MSQHPVPAPTDPATTGAEAAADLVLLVNDSAEQIRRAVDALITHVDQAWRQDLADALAIVPAVQPVAEAQLRGPIQVILDRIRGKISSYTPGGDVVQDIIREFGQPWSQVTASLKSASEAVTATSPTAEWQGQAGSAYAEQRQKQLETLDALAQVAGDQARISKSIAVANAGILTSVNEMVQKADQRVAGQLGGPSVGFSFRRCVTAAGAIQGLLTELGSVVPQMRDHQSSHKDGALGAATNTGRSRIGQTWPGLPG